MSSAAVVISALRVKMFSEMGIKILGLKCLVKWVPDVFSVTDKAHTDLIPIYKNQTLTDLQLKLYGLAV